MKRAHIHGISIDVLMYRAGLITHATTATSRVVVDGGTLPARTEQLAPVSSLRYRTSPSGLSTWLSYTARCYLILRKASRLAAFPGYPVYTSLPCCIVVTMPGPPEAFYPRSS